MGSLGPQHWVGHIENIQIHVVTGPQLGISQYPNSRVIPCQTTEKKHDVPKMASNFLDHLHTPNKEGQSIVLAIFVIFGHILDQITVFTLMELCAYIS